MSLCAIPPWIRSFCTKIAVNITVLIHHHCKPSLGISIAFHLFNVVKGICKNVLYLKYMAIWIRSFSIFSKCRFAKVTIWGRMVMISGSKFQDFVLFWNSCCPTFQSFVRYTFPPCLAVNFRTSIHDIFEISLIH